MEQEGSNSNAGHSSSGHSSYKEPVNGQTDQSTSVKPFGISISRREEASSSYENELNMMFGPNGGTDETVNPVQTTLTSGNSPNHGGVLGFQQFAHPQGVHGGFRIALNATVHQSLRPPEPEPSMASHGVGFYNHQMPSILPPNSFEGMTVSESAWASGPDAFDAPPIEIDDNDNNEMNEFDDEDEDWTINLENLSDEALMALAAYLGKARSGLAEEGILAGLRQHTCDFMELESRDSDEICSVCQEHYAEGQDIGELIGCHHEFHVKCIKDWLLTKNICPNCNAIAMIPN